MRCSLPVLLICLLLYACGVENSPQRLIDSTKDSTAVVAVPQFDISGRYFLWLDNELFSDSTNENYYVILDARETDTLYIAHSVANPCEECRLETQIWIDSKYKDIVRDTGYVTEERTAIPLSRLRYDPERKEPQEISFYLSVRQYHPVETGNKRFLFTLKLGFLPEE